MADLVMHPARCTACRACELACSFHHTSACGTSTSSIHVMYDPATGRLEIALDGSCDSCPTEPAPLCLRFCARGAIAVAEARSI